MRKTCTRRQMLQQSISVASIIGFLPDDFPIEELVGNETTSLEELMDLQKDMRDSSSSYARTCSCTGACRETGVCPAARWTFKTVKGCSACGGDHEIVFGESLTGPWKGVCKVTGVTVYMTE